VSGQKPTPAAPSIVPKPAQMQLGSGSFRLGPKTRIIVDSKSKQALEVGEFLAG
jgi:hypothetical protein